MKIIFICGSLEPGKDGVGDYTRRLAGELIKQGHQIFLIALKDRHISKTCEMEQESEGVNIPALRLAEVEFSKKRFAKAEKIIIQFDPEWLSLQYVPFSFQKKGLPLRLGNQLTKLGEGRHWHIMFHELWVGMDLQSPRRFVWWGFVQRWLIKSLLKNLKPAVLHTQTRLYQYHLEMLGYQAEHLSLFGNIPVVRESTPRPVGKDPTERNRKAISLVLFGGIHPGAPVEEFVKAVAFYARNNDVQITLTIVGRCGKVQEHWIKIWTSFGLPLELLGEQTPASISKILTNGSIGISTTPISLIEKSGAVAAMREHGLPILCVARPWQARDFPNQKLPSGILEYTEENLESCLTARTMKSSTNKLSRVSHQLIESFFITV